MSNLSPEAAQALDVLRAAVAEALDRKRRLGQYAVVWHDGRAMRIEPEDYGYAEHLTLRQSRD
jgi:D-aminopeptidase